LHDDLPPEVAYRIERLCFVKEPSDLGERAEEADKLFWWAVRQLAAKGINPLDEEGVDIAPVHSGQE
jgi:hypothetical protein